MTTLIETIQKRTPIFKDGKNGSFLVTVTFGETSKLIDDNILEDPLIQTSLDDDKVEEMIKTYIEHPSFFISKSIITIALCKKDKTTKYYLIDGQHRINMAKKLYDNKDENSTLLFAFHTIKNDDEGELLFDSLNKDSFRNAKFVGFEIFKKNKINDVKDLIKKKYDGIYLNKKSEKEQLFTVAEFIDNLSEFGFFENDENKKFDKNEIIAKIEKVHKNFFNKLDYLEKTRDKKEAENIFCKKEIDCICDYKNVMFFKNNNFIQVLCGIDTEEYHDYKQVRKTWDKRKRNNVWKNEFGDIDDGICPIYKCGAKLYRNMNHGFHIGHIQSIKNKGRDDESNVRPICANCNMRMGDKNWHDYEDEIIKDNLWKDNVDEDEDDSAPCKNCDKYIKDIDDAYILKTTDGKKMKYKLICKKCNHKLNDRKKLKKKKYVDDSSDSESDDGKYTKKK